MRGVKLFDIQLAEIFESPDSFDAQVVQNGMKVGAYVPLLRSSPLEIENNKHK
jgi:hypothetical protein